MGVFKGENREFSPLRRAQALPGAASITGSNFRRLRRELLLKELTTHRDFTSVIRFVKSLYEVSI